MCINPRVCCRLYIWLQASLIRIKTITGECTGTTSNTSNLSLVSVNLG